MINHTMGKRFYVSYNIGKTKYLISFHDGIKKHDDGSDFFDVKSFKNKKELSNFEQKLLDEGYREV